MRAFIAIELPDTVRRQLSEIVAQLRKTGVKATWVQPDRMHLTLRFLGDVQKEQIDIIADAVRQPLSLHDAFSLVSDGLGAFPNLRRPSVIWATIAPLDPNLARVQQFAETAARSAGLAAETKAYHPHITLARVRNPAAARALGAAVESYPAFRTDAFDVSHVSLFLSELTPRGPVYTRIHEFPMKRSVS